MQDIDLTESPYTGFCNKYAGDFAGTFDGNHKSLINLNGCVFDEVTKDGTVKDLYIVNANKKYGKKYSKCAALADDNYGEIQNCAVIDSEYAVENNLADSGLLVGFNKGVISKCKVENCTIDAHGANIGGIVGRNDGTVSECYSKVSISGANNTVGGIAGANFGIIEECYSDPEELTGYSKYCGGIAGVSKSKSFIKDCVSMFIPEEPEKLLGSAGPFIGSIVGGDDGYTAEYNIGAVTDEPEEPDEDDKSAVRDYEKLLIFFLMVAYIN